MQNLLALLVDCLQGRDAALESLLHLKRLELVWEGRGSLRGEILILLTLQWELRGRCRVDGRRRSFVNELIKELILRGEALR